MVLDFLIKLYYLYNFLPNNNKQKSIQFQEYEYIKHRKSLFGTNNSSRVNPKILTGNYKEIKYDRSYYNKYIKYKLKYIHLLNDLIK